MGWNEKESFKPKYDINVQIRLKAKNLWLVIWLGGCIFFNFYNKNNLQALHEKKNFIAEQIDHQYQDLPSQKIFESRVIRFVTTSP